MCRHEDICISRLKFYQKMGTTHWNQLHRFIPSWHLHSHRFLPVLEHRVSEALQSFKQKTAYVRTTLKKKNIYVSKVKHSSLYFIQWYFFTEASKKSLLWTSRAKAEKAQQSRNAFSWQDKETMLKQVKSRAVGNNNNKRQKKPWKLL